MTLAVHPALKPKRALAETHQGPTVDVAALSEVERAAFGLSHTGSIEDLFSDGTPLGDHAITQSVATLCATLRKRGSTTFDCETAAKPEFAHEPKAALDYHKGRIILVQQGDLRGQYLLWWETLPQEAKEHVLSLLADPDVRKFGSNLKYDVGMMMAEQGVDRDFERLIDTQIAEQLLCCGLTGDIEQTLGMTSLGAMASRWLGWSLPKDEELRTGWEQLTPGAWPDPAKRFYAADDVVVPIHLAKKQLAWLEELGLTETMRLEMKYLPRLAEMEVRGIGFNQEQWRKLSEDVERELAEAMQTLDRLFSVKTQYQVDLAGNITRSRDKNYGASEELRDLIHTYMKEKHDILVFLTNQQLADALVASGMREDRVAKLFESRMLRKEGQTRGGEKVGYPNMTDYLTGSDHVPNRFEQYRDRLPASAFVIPATESDDLLFQKILWETPDELIDDVPEIPSKTGLPPELVDPILAYRDLTTKKTRYAFSWFDLINPITQRIHASYTQAATDTGRTSSQKPNLNNLPRSQKYRDPFEAAPGHKIVGADASQIEPRIVAELSHCGTYMRVFWSENPESEGFRVWCHNVTEPLDLYGTLGAQMGIMPSDAEKKRVAKLDENRRGRDDAKIGVQGQGYGTGKPKFHRQYILDTKQYQPRAKSDRIFDGFWGAAQEVKQTLDELSKIADAKRSKRKVHHPFLRTRLTYSETQGGRKRFFHPDSRACYTQGRNHPIQGAGADWMKLAVILLHQKARAANIPGWVLLTIHDELLGESPVEHAAEYSRLMEEAMVEAGAFYLEHVPLKAEGYVADRWKK